MIQNHVRNTLKIYSDFSGLQDTTSATIKFDTCGVKSEPILSI